MKKIISFSFLAAVYLSSVFAQTAKTESVYTDLAAAKCKTIESSNEEAGFYRGECAGVSGYKLEVLESDLRQTINVFAPGGKKFELDLWSKVSSGFSSLGNKAEWRISRSGETVKPKALIVRYDASESPEKPEQTTSYLVVVKITKNEICVTDVVKPSASANSRTRILADGSSNKPCKSEN